MGLLVVHLPTPGPTAEQRAALFAKNVAARLLQTGWEAARAGRLNEAERDFVEAVKQNPRQYDAWGGLIRVQVQAGRLDAALQSLTKARAAGLPKPAAHAYAAMLAAMSGDHATARHELQQLPANAVDDPILKDVVQVTQQILSGTR
jgi:Flp pilus assembly protein TadD